MSDEKGKDVKETLASEAKGLAVEVYRDAAKPAVGEVGHVVGGIAKLVLWPIRKLVDGANGALDRLGTKLEKKTAHIPPDRLLPPPATIGGPAALQYAMLGEGEEAAELREMFENLLVTSMDRETASQAHPAFVSMLSQLTPDEAWILKSIDRREYGLVHLQAQTSAGPQNFGFLTLLGRGCGIDESRLQEYVSNLERLGILKIDDTMTLVNLDGDYKVLEKVIEQEYGDRLRSLHYAGSVSVTPLGERFLDTCVRPRKT